VRKQATHPVFCPVALAYDSRHPETTIRAIVVDGCTGFICIRCGTAQAVNACWGPQNRFQGCCSCKLEHLVMWQSWGLQSAGL
jgi:hypothetical protein